MKHPARLHFYPKFNHLSLVAIIGSRHRKRMCLAVCDCGKQTRVLLVNLRNGHTKSCGHLRKKTFPRWAIKHGHRPRGSRTPTYISWSAIHDRCGNPKFPWYADVRVCKRWSGPDGFQNFLADVGERKPGTTLGRLLDMGDYEVGNVAWMSQAEQVAEQRKKRKFMKGVLDQYVRRKKL